MIHKDSATNTLTIKHNGKLDKYENNTMLNPEQLIRQFPYNSDRMNYLSCAWTGVCELAQDKKISKEETMKYLELIKKMQILFASM